MPVHRPAGALAQRRRIHRTGPTLEQPVRRHGNAGARQLGQGHEEPPHPVVPGCVASDCGVGSVLQDLPDQLGEHPAAARFHEGANAGAVHRLDLLAEPDRVGQLAGQQRPDLTGIGRVGLCRRVCEDIDGRGVDIDRRQRMGKGRLCPGHHGAVERAGHRDRTAGHSRHFECGHRLVHAGRRPGQHDLARAVVVGYHHPTRDPSGQRREDAADVPGRSGHGHHGAGIVAGCTEHRPPPLLAEGEQARFGQCPGHRQGHQLAVAVAAGNGGSDATGAEELRHGQAGDAQRRLCHPGIGQGLALLVTVGIAERGRRVHAFGPGRTKSEPPLQAGEGHEQVGEHSRPLAPLAGIEERNRAACRRCRTRRSGCRRRSLCSACRRRCLSRCEEHALAWIGLSIPCLSELGREVGQIVGHHCHLYGRPAAGRAAKAAVSGRAVKAAVSGRAVKAAVSAQGRRVRQGRPFRTQYGRGPRPPEPRPPTRRPCRPDRAASTA